MIFSILQRNSPLSIILFPIIIVGLWASCAINPSFTAQYYDVHPMPLYKLLYDIHISNHYLGMLSMFAAIGLNLFLLSRLNSLFRLLEKRSSFYLLLYILFTAVFIEFKQFNPMHFALTWVLLAFISIFKLYKNEHNLQITFEAGLFISIGALIYANTIVFAPLLFIGLISLVPFNWRQWMSCIIGLLTPIICIFAWAFIFNKTSFLLNLFSYNIITWHKTLEISVIDMGYIAIIALIFIAALLFSFSGIIKKIAIQKYYFILFAFIILIGVTYITIPSAGIDIFFFSMIPLCFFITNYMLHLKIWIVVEFISTVLIAYAVLLQII